MSEYKPEEVTRLLIQINEGKGNAVEQLMPLVYNEFRAIAGNYFRRENAGHTLQPTALVNEAYMKLVNQKDVDWKGRSQFFAIGAQAMRRILVDHARSKNREKRGGGQDVLSLEEELTVSPNNEYDLLMIEDALEKLEKIDERQAKVVELRFFGGLTVEEVAEVLGVSKRTVEGEWTMVRAWLRKEFAPES